MAQQKGATASIMLGFESTFGTAATAGFILPVNYGENLVGTQNINSRNTIRGNRNPNQGFRGNRQVGGTIVVPVDSVALPYWLTLLFGDPTSSGGPNYIHEWKIANTQPSGTIEKAFTDLTTARYNRFLGCKINGFTIDFGGDGELVINFNVVGAEDSWQTSAFDGTPDTISLSAINNFDGAVAEGGGASTIITRVSLDVQMGLDMRDENPAGQRRGRHREQPQGDLHALGQQCFRAGAAGAGIRAAGCAHCQPGRDSAGSALHRPLRERQRGKRDRGPHHQHNRILQPGGLTMRKIELSTGSMDVRSLTRKEIKGGKDFGMGYIAPGITLENYDDYRDYVIGCLVGDEARDTMPNRDQNDLLSAVLKETWGDPGEEKNLSTSGPNDQTDDEAPPAPDA